MRKGWVDGKTELSKEMSPFRIRDELARKCSSTVLLNLKAELDGEGKWSLYIRVLFNYFTAAAPHHPI